MNEVYSIANFKRGWESHTEEVERMSAATEALGEAVDVAWDLLPWEEWGLIVEALRGRAPRGRDDTSVALRRVRSLSKRKGLEKEIERWVSVVEMNHAWALEEEEGL